MVTISVYYSNATHELGYNVAIVDNGRTVFTKERLGDDPGEAAAHAIKYQARYPRSKIIGCKDVMDLVQYATSE